MTRTPPPSAPTEAKWREAIAGYTCCEVIGRGWLIYSIASGLCVKVAIGMQEAHDWIARHDGRKVITNE